MSFVENGEVKLPQGRRELPRNPLLRTLSTSDTRTGTSARASVDQTKDDKVARNQLHKRDQRDVLTGGASGAMHAAHILNAVRKDKTRKAEVEEILTRQCILGYGKLFDLDSIVNIFLLEASLHGMFDLYNFITILPVKANLQLIANHLKGSNDVWNDQCLASKPPQVVKRPLQLILSVYTIPIWQVLVLQHKAWFTDGRAIDIFSRPYLADNIPQDLGDPVMLWEPWTTFKSDDHSVLRHCSSRQPRHFIHCPSGKIPVEIRPLIDSGNVAHIPTNRTEEEYLSPICAIINAHDKFSHAIRNKYPSMGSENSEMRVVAELCREIVELFFYYPALPALQEGAAAKSRASSSGYGQEGSGHGRKGSGDSTASSGSGDSTATVTVEGRDSQMVVDEDDKPYIDPDTGREHLSNREFKLAMAKVKDGETPVGERVEMFYLALRGVQPYQPLPSELEM